MAEVEVEVEVDGSEVTGVMFPSELVEGPELSLEGAAAMRSGHAEAKARHEWNVNRLARLRLDRDRLNDLIRVAVQDESLSRRALAIYDKAEADDAADES